MSELTRQQAKAIEALLTCVTVKEAAEQIGVHPDSITRWRRSPEFREALRAAQQMRIEEANTSLAKVSAQMVDCLVDIANDPQNPAHSRVAAARAVLMRATASHAGDEKRDDLFDEDDDEGDAAFFRNYAASMQQHAQTR